MPELEHLITDRTQSDVDRVRHLLQRGYEMTQAERAELITAKGAYNASDLNRVGAAVAYLTERFGSVGYLVDTSPRTDWTAADAPTPSDMTAYLLDVRKLRAAVAVMQTTPAVPPDAEKLTFSEANNIEKILLDIEMLLNNMAAAWFYSGEIYSGEV